MKRFLSIIATTMTVAFAVGSANAADVTLRFHQFLSLKADIPARGIEPWIKKIEEESNGRIKIEHYPSMQLGGAPPSLYGQARDGVVDIIWTVLGYTPGLFPTAEAFELPFMTGDAESVALLPCKNIWKPTAWMILRMSIHLGSHTWTRHHACERPSH